MKRRSPAFQFAETLEEGQLHDSVAELLDWILIPPTFYSTFPAGYGKLSVVMASRLKRRGMMPGMPDIFIFSHKEHTGTGTGWTVHHPHIVGIELKIPGRYPTSNQRNAHAKLQAVGIRVYVCKSIEDVVKTLSDEGIEYRDWLRYKEGQRAMEVSP